MGSFEQKHFRHQAYWVASLVANFIDKSVHIELIIANNESLEVIGAVEFKNVTSLKQTYSSFENVLPSLLGIETEKENMSTKYTVVTDVCEITFVTSDEPLVFWKDQDAE